jgi:hypothetical protein
MSGYVSTINGSGFGRDFMYGVMLDVLPTELRLLPPLRGTSNDVLLGTHQAGKNGAIYEGATVPNPYTGSGSYKYKIMPSTLAESTSLYEASLGRSLKDCEGNYFANPAKPWTADVTAGKTFLRGPAGEGVFGDWSQWLIDGTYTDNWSHSFEANSLIAANNSQPLQFNYDAIKVPYTGASGTLYGKQFPVTGAGSVRLSITQALNDTCNGCQVRYKVNGALKYIRVLESFSVDLDPLPPHLPISGWWMEDRIIFNNSLSPCFDSAGSSEWTATPQQRLVILWRMFNTVSYGVETFGVPQFTNNEGTPTEVSVRFTI